MNFNMRKDMGATIVTEYDGWPVLVIDTSVEEGMQFLAHFGGAGFMLIDNDTGLHLGDEVYTGFAIAVADRVLDELPLATLNAVMEHELRHCQRGDVGYASMTREQIAVMEIDCDHAGVIRYGANAMATGIVTLSIMGGAARGLTAKQALEELGANYPGRWEALLAATGKKITVASMIDQISAMFDKTA